MAQLRVVFKIANLFQFGLLFRKLRGRNVNVNYEHGVGK
jgi:hypothetical protein